jgi:hypothetical protein
MLVALSVETWRRIEFFLGPAVVIGWATIVVNGTSTTRTTPRVG